MPKGKSRSPAVSILNAVVIFALAVVLVLLCLYFHLRNSGEINISDEPPQEITTAEYAVIPSPNTETTISVTETSISPDETTALPEETELPPEETPPNPYDYDVEFFTGNLFIGDSIATGLTHYELIPPEYVFAQVGLSASTAVTHPIPDLSDPDKAEKTAPQKVYELQPEYIFIMLGTNSIAYHNNVYLTEQMSLFIDALREVSPYSSIALISIPPVTAKYEAAHIQKLDIIIDYNEKLEELAGQKNCQYIDTFSILTDETGYFSLNYAENDGLHFKSRAYPPLLSKIQSELT
ncbi:MAG: GDSL-type esterase/lipase family protein [Oscillospiraceae bacterium]|nr:GDSL-type esterase/lipase family protein [Oscillospiraceae bacterium]